MRPLMFCLAIFVIAAFLSPRQSSAQCRGSACGEAVVQFWMPSGHQPLLGSTIIDRPILGAPVRAVARVTVAVRTREHRPVARVLSFRWLRCR